jgi:hypothetical protein
MQYLRLRSCIVVCKGEHIRVFQSTSPEQMVAMLSRANQGLLSTTVDQLWDKLSSMSNESPCQNQRRVS